MLGIFKMFRYSILWVLEYFMETINLKQAKFVVSENMGFQQCDGKQYLWELNCVGIQNMLVFKFVGTQKIMGTSKSWIKPCGYSKYGFSAICGYSKFVGTQLCVFKMHGCSNFLGYSKSMKHKNLWVNKICG